MYCSTSAKVILVCSQIIITPDCNSSRSGGWVWSKGRVDTSRNRSQNGVSSRRQDTQWRQRKEKAFHGESFFQKVEEVYWETNFPGRNGFASVNFIFKSHRVYRKLCSFNKPRPSGMHHRQRGVLPVMKDKTQMFVVPKLITDSFNQTRGNNKRKKITISGEDNWNRIDYKLFQIFRSCSPSRSR